jgi:hypothetical protein
VKRSGRDEPIWVAMYIFMETTQGISLYSYLYLKVAKMPCFAYCLLCFLFNIIRGKFCPEEGRVAGPYNAYTCK